MLKARIYGRVRKHSLRKELQIKGLLDAISGVLNPRMNVKLVVQISQDNRLANCTQNIVNSYDDPGPLDKKA